jgi:hypothetical protein
VKPAKRVERSGVNTTLRLIAEHESDDSERVGRGVSLLRSIYAVFRVETARGRAVSRTATDNKLKVIRHHIATVVAALEPIQEELESDESVVIRCLGAIRDRSTRCGSLNTV